MGFLSRFFLAIRRRETPFYDRLYRIAKKIRSFNMPCSRRFHGFLYKEWATRTMLWHEFWRVVYYEPMFKSQCKKIGKGFRLEYAGNGICRILGNLNLYIGDNVYFFDNIGLSATRVYDEPELHIESEAIVGPSCRFHVAQKVHLGYKSMIGAGTFITDNPGHPSNAIDRLDQRGGLPEKSRIQPVHIGDFTFLGQGCTVYPGAHVGDGVLAKAGTHIMGTIPPFTAIGGNPGQVLRLLHIPKKMIEYVGEEKYQQWIAEQDAYLEKHPNTKGRRSKRGT